MYVYIYYMKKLCLDTYTDSSIHPVVPPPHRFVGLAGNELLCTLEVSGALTTCTCNAGSSGPNFNCTSCVAGKYKALKGSALCTDCPIETPRSPTGSVKASDCTGMCSSGFYGNPDATPAVPCTPCAAGKFLTRTTVTDTCQVCAAGKYGVATGQTSEASCTACPAGTYSTAIGASASSTCSDCPSNSNSPAGRNVDSVQHRVLVRLCGVMRWPAGLLYAPRGALLAY
jgi:hypothetical protein